MIHELFEEQVSRSPDAVALVFREGTLSYRELNRRADDLALQLSALGVGPGVLAALFFDRSLEMVVSMLAVLKAGGAYVPLDPMHPPNRTASILADAQPAVLLTHAPVRSRLPSLGSHIVVIDADAPTTAQREPAAKRVLSGGELAYVIFTSGSTGKPKGVEIEHRAVVNMLKSMQRRPGLGSEDRLLAITTLTFDIAVLEIFLPLVCGARVVIAPSSAAGDAAELADLIRECGATVLQATPSTLRILLDAGWSGERSLKILCGGEAWTAQLAKGILERCGSLWNMYGPTETTVWSAVRKVEAGQPIVIGSPIAKTSLYVLDATLQLVPVGVPGELCIGGSGVARGYLRQPELTHERFLADPFKTEPGARMYRTGDLVRRLPDGTLEFLGRLDHQVKIAGNCIELGEIETSLARHPDVKQCVVVASEGSQGHRRLAAYIIPETGKTVRTSDLRQFLAETLPTYMLPSFFVPLSSFPMTANGKLDRKALPSPDITVEAVDGAPVEPRTPTEQAIAKVWRERLSLERVGTRNNFFDLGGYSLLAAQVIADINKTLKVHLNIRAIFENPTIKQLAMLIEQKDHARPGSRFVTLMSGNVGPPLYIIGASLPEHRVAQLIGKDRAIFAVDLPLPAKWSDAIQAGDQAAMPTIEQLGALYGSVLHEHVGSSSCVVVGCYAKGKIAFEAARTLQRAGGNVTLVLLIDAFVGIGGNRGLAWRSLSSIWRPLAEPAGDTPYIDRLSVSFRSFWHLLRWMLQRMPGGVKYRVMQMVSPVTLPSHMDNKDGVPFERSTLSRFLRIATLSFHPSPLDAPGALFRAEYPDEELLPGHDITNGWRDLFTRGLEIVQARGDHISIIADENAELFGRQVNTVLDRYPGNLSYEHRRPA